MVDSFEENTETGFLSKPDGYYQNDREEMLRYIPDGIKTSLEFGCGYGEFSALLKKDLNLETWAIEIDNNSAREAAGKIDKVICGDAVESLSKIPDNYFDCIILFDILEHLPDPYNFLKTLKRKLSHRGVVVASIPNIRYYRVFVNYVIHGNWDYKSHGVMDNTHLRFFTYKSIIKMLENLKFEILKIEGIHKTSSRTYKLLNILLLNCLSDVKFKHFAVVFRDRP